MRCLVCQTCWANGRALEKVAEQRDLQVQVYASLKAASQVESGQKGPPGQFLHSEGSWYLEPASGEAIETDVIMIVRRHLDRCLD